MAEEAFLINPPRKLRRKVIGRRRRRKNPVGETLVTIGANPMGQNPWYGDSQGHRIAALMRWGKIPRGRVKRYRKRGRPRVRVAKRRVVRRRVVMHRRRRTVDRRTKLFRQDLKRQYSQFRGFSALTSGPKRRFRFVSGQGWVKRRRNVMTKRKRSRRKNTWFGQPRRHRRAARKGWRKGHMVPFTHSRRSRRRRVRSFSNFFTNPMPGAAANPRRRRSRVKHRRSYGRRRRTNPAIMAEFGRFTSGIMDFRGWVPLAITGGFSAITGALVPGMLGMDALSNPWGRLGVQTAVAIGGGIVVERFVDKRHGQAWMIVGVAMVGYQLLKQFVLVPYFPQFAVGLGSYNDYYPDSGYVDRDQVSQQVGAFPQAVGAYPGVGAYTDEVGAYPYDGSGY